tara:strand:+ start:6357 stop:9044 length:2688 start_codon:yes stop_codon:yes gene_type:complete
MEAPPQKATPLAPATSLGQYKIRERLGTGILGYTYLAWDTVRMREVVVKELLPEDLAYREASSQQVLTFEGNPLYADLFATTLKDFVGEAKQWLEFDHPRLVRVFDVFEANGTAYCVLQYVVGRSLSEEIRRRESEEDWLSAAELYDLISGVLNGVEYLHEKGALHLNLAPDNVVLSGPKKEPKIIEFGAAKAAYEKNDDGERLISPYLPIDRFMTDVVEGPSSDLYSLGALFYHVVSRQRPTPAPTRLTSPEKSPALAGNEELVDRFGAEMLGAIDRAFAVDAEDRPASVDELRKLLGKRPAPPVVEAPAVETEDTDELDGTSQPPHEVASQDAGAPVPMPVAPPAPLPSFPVPAPVPEPEPELEKKKEAVVPPVAQPVEPEEWAKEPVAAKPAIEVTDGLFDDGEDGEILEEVAGEEGLYPPENVQFTTYRPKSLPADVWSQMLVFTHLDDKPIDAPANAAHPVEEVRAQAGDVLGEKISQYLDTTKDSSLAIPREAEIRLVPHVPGVRFNPPSRSFFWVRGVNVHKEEFQLRPIGSGATEAAGSLSIYLGSLMVAEVPLRFQITPAGVSLPSEVEQVSDSAALYRRIFPSYSRQDLAIVEQIENYGKTLGDRYLRDLLELRAGEAWHPQLMNLIEEADVFQLFWSSNSRQSDVVMQEYRHALSLRRQNFIRPTYWEMPMPVAPRELSSIHFQALKLASNPLADYSASVNREIPSQTRIIERSEEDDEPAPVYGGGGDEEEATRLIGRPEPKASTNEEKLEGPEPSFEPSETTEAEDGTVKEIISGKDFDIHDLGGNLQFEPGDNSMEEEPPVRRSVSPPPAPPMPAPAATSRPSADLDQTQEFRLPPAACSLPPQATPPRSGLKIVSILITLLVITLLATLAVLAFRSGWLG